MKNSLDKESLDKFGAFVVRNLRDKMFFDLEMLLRGAWKAPESQELQRRLARFSDAQKQVVLDLAESIVTSGMSGFLFALQEEADSDGAIKVLVDGHEVAKLSDGLHGELFGDDGWIVRYSEYPSEVEIERSRWATEEIQKMFGNSGEDDG